MFVKSLYFAILLSSVKKITGVCEQNYVTFCDCVSDLHNSERVKWTDVIIDSSQYACSSVVDSDTFDVLDEIKMLFVVNATDNIQKNAFTIIGQTLKYLKFYDNQILTITSETFSGFRKINRLILTNNNIQTIEEFSFRGSVIKNLDLSNNHLEVLPENALRGAQITTISLKNNKLSYINEKAFNNNVEILNLDYNNIEYIDNGFVTNVVNLKQLSLSHNKLSQISDIKILNNVQKLDLSFNNINFISEEDLENLKDLVYMDLSGNKLETLSLKLFKKVKAERMTLLLSYNLLTNIKVPDNTKPMTITLFGNPWNCDCLVKMEEKMIRYNFTTSKCNVELFEAGTFPICIEQGKCVHKPTESRTELRKFMAVVHQRKKHLPCDIFREIKTKDVISMT